MRRESHVRFCESAGVRFPRATRLVLSIKAECLDRIVPLDKAHLRAAVSAFAQHYHEERPHQGLGNELIASKTTSNGTARYTAMSGLAACSSSTTVRLHSPMGQVYA